MKILHKPSLRQVGAPDPEMLTSPILDESELDERAGSPDPGKESGACLFNGERFALGTYVLSGDEVLQCRPRGVWVRKGEQKP